KNIITVFLLNPPVSALHPKTLNSPIFIQFKNTQPDLSKYRLFAHFLKNTPSFQIVFDYYL
ncbi:MAG: hypothetical protein K8I03_02210, partial [Ignavibacteria bacterium]|nr:hypothetical protein [Ignavibacteria bacterium]